MHITLPCETPNGATANTHRLQAVNIGSDGSIGVVINSFTNDTTDRVVWQEIHQMPVEAFNAAPYPQCVFDWLTGNGGFFSGGQVIADQPELDKSKITRKVNVERIRNARIAEGCTTPFGIVDTDPESVRNIMAAYQASTLALMTQSPFSTTWRMQNNTFQTMDATGMVAIGNAVLARVTACYERSWALKALVDDAESIEDIDAIGFETGWPAV